MFCINKAVLWYTYNFFMYIAFFLFLFRMTIDRHGHLAYSHIRDTTFDVSDYLIELKNQLKSWRDVYWRLWGTINYLTCARCEETFPCTDLGHCKYHPEAANFSGNSMTGEYPCCGLRIIRFDPTQENKVWLWRTI